MNAWLVRNGWAVAYRQYSQDYVSDEDSAKGAKKGIWQGGI
ncbi:MAG: thermonuclease family protein [Pseudomonadota bacterium]|nr:thermonuclease family protein [Pseudomonadota bacterium]